MVIASARSPFRQNGRRPGDYAGLWVKAPGGGQTESSGSAVAHATRACLGNVGLTASSRLGVQQEPGETKRAP